LAKNRQRTRGGGTKKHPEAAEQNRTVDTRIFRTQEHRKVGAISFTSIYLKKEKRKYFLGISSFSIYYSHSNRS
jgi:hypothetical protein